jgi:hypothetical protein
MPSPMVPGNRAPAPNTTNPVQSSQAAFFQQGQNRAAFPLGLGSQSQLPGQYGNEQGFKGPAGMMFSRPINPQNQGPSTSMQPSMPGDRYNGPPLGTGDGSAVPFGPNFPSMFRHMPPGSRFPPPPNFSNPPPDHNMMANDNPSIPHDGQPGRPGMPGASNSYMGNKANQSNYNQGQVQNTLGNQTNFSHAPGTERTQGERGSNPPIHPHLQMPFHQVIFILLTIHT